MSTDDLAWTIEDACRNAWPCPRQLFLDDWILFAAGGTSRRTNSVNPSRYGSRDPTPVIDTAERVYGELAQSALFRVPSMVPEIDVVLDRHGYSLEGGTCTLLADLADHASLGLGDVDLTATAEPDWLSARARLNTASAEAERAYRGIVESLLLPRAFAACRIDGAIVALAYGAIHDKLMVLESVVTHPDYRRQGLGMRIVTGLMDWAKRSGADGACLQVLADNPAARALYHAVGFRTEVYRYHYRRKKLLA